MPLMMIGLLLLLVFEGKVSDTAALYFSKSGPGSQHALWFVLLGAGLVIGFLAQRTRFCTMGSIRDVVLVGDTHPVNGVDALVVVAVGMNLILGQFGPAGFFGQPMAHSQHL
jgi:YedE family putative selenium metabolism protein